ncbi:M10 family metallopeptidase C-terminal domain-containing protein [Pseudomonas sp. NFACC13-1]|uniref:M10 family metallopeptidase C-terminal domain-containing protein n=1 Tax=Pseudomonas sp. NFACC13-1 TaxID=1566245 RepID=UPI000884B4A5|nr:type I secretion target [Pseudomonas sp. NFACC13-1]SDB64355.1 delta-60 repeat domain-containing protein [Pseudomonas sp. NFACC13-1]
MATSYSAPGIMIVDINGYADNAYDMVIQPDGSVLVAGLSYHALDLDYGQDFSLAHLNADGSVDSTYGNAGRLVIHKQIPLEKDYSLRVQTDGAVVAAHEGHDNTPIVQRWGPDGKADAVFNANAQASLSSGFGHAPIVEVNADGSVLVGAVEGSTLRVTQLHADGTQDLSFGTNGILTLQAPGTLDFVLGLTSLADGGILVQGAPNFHNSLLKYTAGGELDTHFGVNGIMEIDVGSYGGGVAVQDDGKILLSNTTSFDDFTVLRFNADGSPDVSFGNQGSVSINLPGDYAAGKAIAVQDDGKILLGGSAFANGGSDFAAVRLNADGSLDSTFGSTDGSTRLVGSSGSDVLEGLGTDEILRGLAGDDVLQGNLGRDLLSGGAGNDVFRYASVTDSFRTADSSGSDRILDFNPAEDRIDLSALGFTGIGNGYDGTLLIGNNADDTRTYLKSFEANADGQRFELVLDGNFAGQLDDSNLMFSTASVARSSIDNAALPGDLSAPEPVELTLIGTVDPHTYNVV